VTADLVRAAGYVVVPGALSADDVARARAETLAICRGERGAYQGLVEGASSLDDDELLGRYLAVHFPHKISPIFKDLLAAPAIVDQLTGLIGNDVKCMQSMLFVKAAGKPGQAWHQDERYIPTRDRSLWGAWLALDDATIDNGCLWVLPGSHRAGVLWPTRPHGSDEFDDSEEAFDFPDDAGRAVPVEVASGDAVLFHGYLLHRSLRNRLPTGFRRALVNHYMSAQSLLPWTWDGRLSPGDDMRDIVVVAGTDPYAYKGVHDLTYPYVRSETEGQPT
jgi:ectoine hydroxylase-related dioxygenase (phytanoyl-CoA dioxygenase family)